MRTAETATPASSLVVGGISESNNQQTSTRLQQWKLAVVLPLPREVSTPDEMVEDGPGTGDGPWHVVLRSMISSSWYTTRTRCLLTAALAGDIAELPKKYGEVEVLQQSWAASCR